MLNAIRLWHDNKNAQIIARDYKYGLESDKVRDEASRRVHVSYFWLNQRYSC